MLIILIKSIYHLKNYWNNINWTRATFDFLIENIKVQFNKSIIQDQVIGSKVLMPQSLGEPATQMTLNTFHFGGVSSKSNVMRQLFSSKELLHISKSIKSFYKYLFQDNEIKYDKTKAQDLA